MSNSNDDKRWEQGLYKENSNLKLLLEARAKTQEPINTFDLSNTNLENINLVNQGHHEGFKLMNCFPGGPNRTQSL